MKITVVYLKISRHQLEIWWSQIEFTGGASKRIFAIFKSIIDSVKFSNTLQLSPFYWGIHFVLERHDEDVHFVLDRQRHDEDVHFVLDRHDACVLCPMLSVSICICLVSNATRIYLSVSCVQCYTCLSLCVLCPMLPVSLSLFLVSNVTHVYLYVSCAQC